MVESSNNPGMWPSLYQPFRNLGTRLADWLSPASEASSDEEAYRITMELPGVEDSDVDVQVHDGVMTIKGEKKTEREDKGDTWYFSERQYGSFSRSFRLPADADESGVKAEMKDGVLRLTVPKAAPPAAQAKSVKIEKG